MTMGRMSIEQKLADRVHETLMRMDFEPADFALYLHRCGWMMQEVMFKVVLRLIEHWTIDYDNQETRGSDRYLILTMRARQLQDVIDNWDVKS